MMSPATSGWQQIAWTCSLWVMFGSQFLDNSSTDLKKMFTVFERSIDVVHFLYCNPLDIFASWLRKCDQIRPTVVYALHKSLILVFLKTTEASNPQIYTNVILDCFYTLTGSYVISHFCSAINHVHATGTTTATNFSVTKWSFEKSRNLLGSSGLFNLVFTFWPEMTSPVTSIGSKSHKRVHFGSCSGHKFSIMVHPI